MSARIFYFLFFSLFILFHKQIKVFAINLKMMLDLYKN